MKIADFTAIQLDVFRKECNFTDIESRCFELKAKDRSDVQLAMELNVSESTIAVTIRRVRNKIDTVLRHNVQRVDVPDIFGGCNRSCPNIVYHTMAAWLHSAEPIGRRCVSERSLCGAKRPLHLLI